MRDDTFFLSFSILYIRFIPLRVYKRRDDGRRVLPLYREKSYMLCVDVVKLIRWSSNHIMCVSAAVNCFESFISKLTKLTGFARHEISIGIEFVNSNKKAN